MKALTICQPYAHLILLPEADVRHKRIENRTWPTMYRGPLLIHAGKSRAWLDITSDKYVGDFDGEYLIPIDEMVFGGIVGIAKLANCVRVEAIHAGQYDDIYPWAKSHEHAEGPWCWVLTDVRKFAAPIPWRGAQGLFEVPADAINQDVKP